MKPFAAKSIPCPRGALALPGDKSIAHRAIIFSALSRGRTTLENFPFNDDCLATLEAFRRLGVKISLDPLSRGKDRGRVIVYAQGLFGLKKPKGPIFSGGSGTTMRLLLGVLAGQNFSSRLTAGASLSARPMRRVTEPLRQMGAQIRSKVKGQRSKAEEYPPITIKGGKLCGITYKMPVASAQVKSAVLLAGLYAKGPTVVIEPAATRDHTERMLKFFGADINCSSGKITLKRPKQLVSPGKISIPADISSAAFFIVLAVLIPGSRIRIKNVSLNPSRMGLIKVLKRMGADIRVLRPKHKTCGPEPAGEIIAQGSRLRGVNVKKEEIPSLIDEIPLLMVAAGLARGRTMIRGAEELRVKEADRILAMSSNLKKMGVPVSVCRGAAGREDIIIEGVPGLKGARVNSFGDHRTAMSMFVAGSVAGGTTVIDDVSCIAKSFPGFIRAFDRL